MCDWRDKSQLSDSTIQLNEATFLSQFYFFYLLHFPTKHIIPSVFISVGALAVALLFYYEILGYSSIRVIRLSSYFLYEEVFLLSLVPVVIPVFHFFRRRKTEDYNEPSPRKFLRESFGILWIFDGILQMQLPFLTLFVQYNLIPLLGSEPIVTFLTKYAIALWNVNPPVIDVIASLLQVYIGAFFLIYKKGFIFRFSQISAIGWSLTIWIFGEGFGGILSSSASLLTGSPGSALFYAIASFLLLIFEQESSSGRVGTVTKLTMISTFLGFAISQILPSNGFWTALPISFFPSPFAFLNDLTSITAFISREASILNGVYALIMFSIGISWLVVPRHAAYMTLLWGFFTWYVYQGLGIFGMTYSTDPNTGLPLILISLTFLLITRSTDPIQNYKFGLHRRKENLIQ